MRARANGSSGFPALRRTWLLPLALFCCRVALAAAPVTGSLNSLQMENSAAGNVNAERVHADVDEGANWLLRGRTYTAQRFSPLRQISDRSIRSLGVAWSADVPSPSGIEATPVVVDGIIYISLDQDVVEAIDAGTGRLIWRWDPPNLDLTHYFTSWASRVNRGVAVWKGKVFIGTADCRLFALSATTGRQIWEVRNCDPAQGYGSTGAPLVAKDMVIMGNAGADYGAVRGYVSAYDASTGRLIWRFFTVPGNPAKGFEQPELAWAAKTWKGEDWWRHAGGNVWDDIEYDPELNRVYFGTDTDTVSMGQNGDALFTNSIVALDADTGRYLWHYQEVPNDVWEYNATTPIILADLTIRGHQRKVLLQAPRDGFFYVLDRETGRLLSADPFVKVTWASRIDLASGRPVLSRDARLYRDAGRSTVLWPGGEGAHNWQSMSFSPLTGLVYIPALNAPGIYDVDRGTPDVKPYVPSPTAKVQPEGRLVAWDPLARKVRWFVKMRYPYNGGTLVTAGNLVFQGTAEGIFTARRATDGRLLWSMPVVTATQAPPVTYEYHGNQYVLLPVGPSGDVRYLPEYGAPPSANGPSRLIAFALGAHGSVPRGVIAKPAQPMPPRQFASAAVIERGRELFTSAGCLYCHGANMNVPAGGRVPDLRYLPPEIFSSWDQIVLGGALSAAGMPAFGSGKLPMTGEVKPLSPDDAQAIRAFVIDQAWKLYDSTHRPRTGQGREARAHASVTGP